MAKTLTPEWADHKHDLWQQAKVNIAFGGWYLLILSLFNHGSLSIVVAGLIGLLIGYALFPGLLGWYLGYPYTKHAGKRAWQLEKDERDRAAKYDLIITTNWLADLRHDGE